jgi:hypothetical protein
MEFPRRLTMIEREKVARWLHYFKGSPAVDWDAESLPESYKDMRRKDADELLALVGDGEVMEPVWFEVTATGPRRWAYTTKDPKCAKGLREKYGCDVRPLIYGDLRPPAGEQEKGEGDE